MTPRTRFILLFPGRTGSSWLISCLDSHPALDARGEKLVGRSPQSQQRWIRRLYRRGGGRRVRARGFKTKLKDVWDLDGLRAMLMAYDVRVIAMYRRNKIKLAISTINAQRLKAVLGRWNRRRGDATFPPFALEESELRSTLAQCLDRDKQLEAFVGALDLPRLTLHYEELLEALQERMRDVQVFLGVDPASIRSDVVKSTDDDLSRVIVNYVDLRARFDDGPYANMF